MKRMFLMLFTFSLFMIFGCIGGEPEEVACDNICPYGYDYGDNCTCVMDPLHEQTFNVKDGSNFVMFGEQYAVTLHALDDCEDEGIQVNIAGDNAIYEFTDSVELSKIIDGQYYMGKLVLADYDYDTETGSEPCDYDSPYVTIKTYQDEEDQDDVTLDKGDTYSFVLDDDYSFKFNDYSIDINEVEDFSEDYTLNVGDDEELGNDDYSFSVEDIGITTKKVRSDSSSVTREEGTQATFEGDYSVRVDDITYNIDSASVNKDLETMEVNDEITAPDGSKVKVQSINIGLNDCDNDCSVAESTVTLNVMAPGDSYEEHTLADTDVLNVSDRLRITISSIDVDVNATCTNTTESCEITGKTVDIQFTKVGANCDIYNKGADFTVTYPDTTTETISLSADEDYHLTDDLILSLESVNGGLTEPDYSGHCELDDTNVTFTFSSPTYECEITGRKVQFNVERFDDEDSVWVTSDENILGVNFDIDQIIADVTYEDDSCVVTNKEVKVSVSHDSYCDVDSEEIEIEVEGDKEDIEVDDEFEVGPSEIKFVGLDYDLNSRCEPKNVEAQFEVNVPGVDVFNIDEQTEKTVGIFTIYVGDVVMDPKVDDSECLMKNKKAMITINTKYDYANKDLEEGDTIVIGGGKVIIQKIDAVYPEYIESWCTPSNYSAVLKWVPKVSTNNVTSNVTNNVANTTSNATNETENNETENNETEN